VVGREQADRLREHREDAAHEEGGDGLRRVPGLLLRPFQRAGELGEQFRDLARDADALAGRVEGVRLGPDAPEALLYFRLRQVGQVYAEAFAVRELRVVLPGAAEVGVDVEAEADVADDDKGRPAFLGGEVAGVALGLALSLEHGLRPGGGAADRSAALVHRVEAEQDLRARVAALLGFQDEAAALVEVNPTVGGGAVRLVAGDAALVSVIPAGAAGGLRRGQVKGGAELVEEAGVVGAFRLFGAVPARDECIDGGQRAPLPLRHALIAATRPSLSTQS
jgi:hypothetical protein